VSPSDFDRWWQHFRSRTDGDEEPYETARRLRRKLRRVKVAERPRFVGRLIQVLLRQERSYGVALFLLEGLTDPSCLGVIADLLRPLPGLQSDDEESHLADLVRVVAASGDDTLLPVVEEYLLERAIGAHWSSVPWALWPRRKELFGQAWRRFFIDHDPADWKGTLIIRSFLAEPEAILVVRDALAGAPVERWDELRKALIRQAGLITWLSPDQRDALDRVVS
jgi:hypothetical protein